MKKARVTMTLFALVAVGVACKTSPFGRGSARVPKKHRAAPQACPRDRAMTPEPQMGANTRGDQCTRHADCTQKPNGRCFMQRGGARCSYDGCFSDAECESASASAMGVKGGGVCDCRPGADSVVANRCQAGNCRLDADCKGSYCSPSLGSCGHMGGVIGYFCHTSKDECVDDDDCKGKDGKSTGDGSCRYVEEIGHFKCNPAECAG